MREDYIEQLDKMFPNGYLICYTNPDKNLRMSLFNPHRSELIEDIRQVIIKLKNDLDEDMELQG